MPTISQLAPADVISPADLIPISQGGSLHAASVGDLLAQTQPAIIVEPLCLLGRISIGAGGPDTIAVGQGLALNNGTLDATGLSTAALPLQTTLTPTDQLVVVNESVAQLLELTQIRGLFSAGTNIAIDSNGTISATAAGSVATDTLSGLSSVAALGQGDLVGVSQGGLDCTITYGAFLDGLTIDEATQAGLASDSDTFWVAQTGNIMVRQTLAALWPWIMGHLPRWAKPVVELSVNTVLTAAVHNNAILICSSPISISASVAGMGSGFCCDLINASSGSVGLSGNIVTSNGSSSLSLNQSCAIYCATYSAGTAVFASIGAGTVAATAVPGQISSLAASALAANSVQLSWSAPTSGGTVATYTIQYRLTGTTPWLAAGQSGVAASFAIGQLQAATGYDFAVIAGNNAGSGPISTILTVTTPSSSTLPGPPTAVTVSNISATGLVCSWTAPTIGGTGLVYAVQYRVSGQTVWSSATSNLSATTANITNLMAATAYDIQIVASNGSGAGAPSTLITATTSTGASSGGLVTGMTWNLTPSGSYQHGNGSIGVNLWVTPASAAIQFGFSASATIPPTAWTSAVHVNSSLWGAYVPTPATAGTWYVWAEGTDGSLPTAFPTPFTVT